MGPSGAGKSTILDVLAGRKDPKNVTGTIWLNGQSGENVKFVSTYVMQDDALMGELNFAWIWVRVRVRVMGCPRRGYTYIFH